MRTEITSRHLDAAREEARDAELRDADTFTDWLGAQCQNTSTLPVMPLLRDKTAGDLQTMTVPALVALLCDLGQPVQTTVAARDALAERYLATRADKIERAACVRAGEIAADEAADMREAA